MTLAIAPGTHQLGTKGADYLMTRIDELRAMNAPYEDDRWRIRQIMNGGPEGIRAIMAWDQGKGSSGKKAPNLGYDLPAVNMMASGVERLAQKVGVAPTLKMPYGPRDSQAAREGAEKRERIIEGWDHLSRLHLTYPQVGRWLPGYAFVVWVIIPKRDPVSGQLWPHVELRDPYDCWPGFFGPGQQPSEIAFRRSVPTSTLKYLYPEHQWDQLIQRRPIQSAAADGRVVAMHGTGAIDRSWEGKKGGTQIVEYFCGEGTYICAPEFGIVLDYFPNICETGPMFTVAKRFSFDKMVSAYHHVIGLVGMMAKFNVLGLIATELSVFSETNIFGEMEGDRYKQGRRATNQFEANARVEKPKGESNYQLWQQIDRLERQLRIGAAYDAGSDSIAARGGFVTGRGQQELRDPIDANISEYQTVIASAIEDLDTRRLEWEERHERAKTKRVFYIDGDREGAENYVPKKDIAGAWRSRRVYGMMATWDDSTKIVAGLQLMQADVIDPITMQENLHGLDNLPRINQRIDAFRAKRGLLAALEQRAGQGDPGALMALVEINKNPDNTVTILDKYFTPNEPQMTPEEAAMQAGGMVPGAPPGAVPGGGDIGPPPTVQTVLAQLEAGGQAKGGVQTVRSQRR